MRTTTLARLCIEESLHIDFKNRKIIYPPRFYLLFIIRESIEIFFTSEDIFTASGSVKLPKTWKDMLYKFINNSKI